MAQSTWESGRVLSPAPTREPLSSSFPAAGPTTPLAQLAAGSGYPLTAPEASASNQVFLGDECDRDNRQCEQQLYVFKLGVKHRVTETLSE